MPVRFWKLWDWRALRMVLGAYGIHGRLTDVNVEVELSWQVVGKVTVDGDLLAVPAMPAAPGVYQWVFRHDGRERRYVGEAVNLRRRFAHYRSPGPSQSTNQRMKERVLRVVAAGGSVEILCSDKEKFVVDGVAVEPDLRSQFARRVIENAALVALLVSNQDVVNGDGYGELRSDEVLR